LCCAKLSATQPKPLQMTSKANWYTPLNDTTEKKHGTEGRDRSGKKSSLRTNWEGFSQDHQEHVGGDCAGGTSSGPRATFGCRKIKILPRKGANRKGYLPSVSRSSCCRLLDPGSARWAGRMTLVRGAEQHPNSAPVLDNFSCYPHTAHVWFMYIACSWQVPSTTTEPISSRNCEHLLRGPLSPLRIQEFVVRAGRLPARRRICLVD
jgi:hypothetical protein